MTAKTAWAVLVTVSLVLGCADGSVPARQRATLAWTDTPEELARVLAVAPTALLGAAEERYAREEYDSAFLILNVESERAVAVSDGPAEARARMWAGMAAWRLGDYELSRREGEASVRLKREIGLDDELSRSYNALGLLAWNEGRLIEATTWFDSAIVAARRHDDGGGVARAAANVPLVLTQLGDYDGARAGFFDAVIAGAVQGDVRLQANALANLAMLEIRLGDAQSALGRLDEARALYAEIEYATGEANALGQMATAWAAEGELQRAIATAGEGLSIARARGLKQEVSALLEVLADFFVRAGDAREALRLLAEANELNGELGLQVELGNNERRSAEIMADFGEWEVAIVRARRALSIHVSTEDRSEEMVDRLLIARAASRLGDTEAAEAMADSARAISRGLGAVEHRLSGLTLARLAMDRGDARAALRELDRLPDPDWQALDLEASAHLALGDLERARRASERAVTLLERDRGSLEEGAMRSGYFGGRVGPVSRLVEIQVLRGDSVAAFEAAAAVPGRWLAEHLVTASEESGLSALAESERLLRRVDALEEDLDALGGTDESADARTVLEGELAGAWARYEGLARQRESDPRSALVGLGSPSWESIRAAIEPNEMLLLTLVGAESIDLFAARSDGIAHHRIDVGERELEERVRAALAALESGGGTDVPAPLRELGRILLGPLGSGAELQGVERILVVPHGPLANLPFAAVPLPESDDFLVERFEVATLPSAGTLTVRSSYAVAVGPIELFAPLSDSLPGTASEVRAVARLRPGSSSHLGASADERAVRVALEGNRAVHIASHGRLDAGNPMLSMMRVAPRSDTSGDVVVDETLVAGEILGLRVRSPLVFLSGCETGLSAGGISPLGGEGVSLAQAFLFAGAKSVVATLWRVGDDESAAFAESFYRNLEGLDATSALARAQREAIGQGRSLSWAAYTVVGAPVLGESP